MDARPFEGLARPGYDIVVLWDYRSLDVDWSFTAPYEEICVVGWSFGVYAAAATTQSLEPRVTLRMAIGGTLYPCHNSLGIPDRIFRGTLATLSERNLYKFRRRMCGDSATFERFNARAPQRDVAELADELESFLPENLLMHDPCRRCDVAVIGRDDAIVPPVNQWRAWQGTPLLMYSGPHYPDFQSLLDRYVMDKERVGERFGRGFDSYEDAGVVQARIVAELCRLLAGLSIPLSAPGIRILEVGSGTGMMSRHLHRVAPEGYLEMWDLAGDAPVEGPRRLFRRLDAETAIARVPAESFDLIVSASTVQWFNSPLQFVRRCMRALHPGGVLVLSTFVAGNLAEVNAVTGRSLPLLTPNAWLGALGDDYEVLYSRDYCDDLVFDSAADVFRHLRATGVTGLGRSADGEVPLRSVLNRFHPALDGRWHITYRPYILILRKK